MDVVNFESYHNLKLFKQYRYWQKCLCIYIKITHHK